MLTAHPADDQPLLFTAFLFPNAHPAVPVCENSVTAGAPGGVTGIYNFKNIFPLVKELVL